LKVRKTAITGIVLAGLVGFFGINSCAPNLMSSTKSPYSESYSKRVEENEYFQNGQISSQKVYLDGELIRRRYWSIEGVQTFETHFKYSKNEGIYEKIEYSTKPRCEYIESKEQHRGSPEEDNDILRKWFYDEESHNLLLSEYYREGTEIVEKVDTFDKQGNLEKLYIYHYVLGKEEKGRLKGFDCYNAKGGKIGSYVEDTTLDIEKIITSRDAKPEQIKEWLRIYRDDTRIPVAIIDSGFDINHETLTHKIWKNPKEELNGIDDDGNGWVDDVMGWHRKVSKWFGLYTDSPNINETIILRFHEPPISHGTHVASIALEDLDKFALVGFAGDMSHPDYLKRIGHFLKDHDIRFANMSFGYGDRNSPFAPESESFYALEKLIKGNPQTLIVVAAGNDGGDFEAPSSIPYSHGFRSYPPSFPYENLLVVGALDADDLIESELQNYKPVDFSNVGDETVDVFAPGVKVPGALIGDGNIGLSGTSMASPYALNCVLSVYEENPNLTALEIKEIVIKTAYVPDKPLPCVSGGIIHPERMLSVARLLAKSPLLTIDEAVSNVRASEK